MSESPGDSVVNSHNEWDPLEEVIVGRLEGATVPTAHVSLHFNDKSMPARVARWFSGRRYPRWLVRRAQRELEGFIELLEGEGVRVRRPDPRDFHVRVRTPLWSSRGFCSACPRDLFLVIGNEIIETPSCWRSRYFEARAYRTLFKGYFSQGAKWTAAPRPELADELFDPNYREPKAGEPLCYVTNEFEPVFDAADFMRCGRDLFCIRSNVTNRSGIEWLRRHLGPEYRIHELENRCTRPMHIDNTFLPLAPGKVLVNPEFLDLERLPPILKSWELLIAPEPDPMEGVLARINPCSRWISLNVLMIDERRVVVEKSQVTLIRALKDWGFLPLPCAFQAYGPFGGAFHCATLDIRRRGVLLDYF